MALSADDRGALQILMVGRLGGGVLVTAPVCRGLDGSRPAVAAETVFRAW
jgi:hypothetical protein